MADDDLDLQDDLDDDTDTGSADGSDAGQDAPPASKPDGDGDKGADRVNDLMSKWQRAEARAKRAEKALAATKQGGDRDAGDDMPPAVRQWVDAAREQAREQFHATDPRLAEYGIPSSSITGTTPDEMRASLKTYSNLIDGIETKVRRRLMTEHGLVAEQVGSSPQQDLDFASMSDAEFEKHVRAVSGLTSF